jgi:predicted nucleic acid-binding protein
MALIISDANIFIDLECAGLTARMFRLDFDFAVPDLLYQNELSRDHPELPGYGLQIRPLGAELISRSMACRGSYPKLSIYDAFALTLARHESAPLLTGDRHLRKAASNEGVQVYGILWTMKQMLIQRLLTLPEVEAAYQAMIAAQRRLPVPEIKRQLKRLGSDTV